METTAAGDAFEMRAIRCPTCEIASETVLGFRGGKYQRHGLGVPTRIVQCRRCGLLYPNPFPYPRAPQQLYGDPDKYFAPANVDELVAWRRTIVRRIVGLVGGSEVTLLDVGTGRGDVLRAAQLESVKAIGTEFSQAMIDRARDLFGLTVLRQSIEELADSWPGPPFDAITLNAVLEHVYDPNSMIASVRRLTRIGSIVYIDVPCEPNLMTFIGRAFNRLRRSEAIYDLQPTWAPFHVFGFNKRALSTLLAKHGFELLELSVWCDPKIPAGKAWSDRARSFVATQINRIANLTGTARNMSGYARRVR
jgi:SAM-dependent methyltransferase